MNERTTPAGGNPDPEPARRHGITNAIVRRFLHSNLSLILVLLALVLGFTALTITPREEDPQIVVPLADVYVNFPGHSAEEVERLVATPLEKILYEIDGVEYVYSMSRRDAAIITVRYYVGQDRERSLVKLYKRIDEHLDVIPPGVTGWVVKPVEIDDVPIVTLTLTSETAGESALRRVAEEMVDRLAAVKNLSRAYAVGGRPRMLYVYLTPDRLRAYHVTPLQVQQALRAANISRTVGEYARDDTAFQVEVGRALVRADQVRELVVGVVGKRPVLLKDVADVVDGPAEAVDYARHGWGPARGFEDEPSFPGSLIGGAERATARSSGPVSKPAVTIALAKKKGANAVWVARDIIAAAEELKRDVIPDDIDVAITRNYGLTANDKVNDLVESLGVAILIVIALLTLGLNWRAGIIVALAIPVVFGLTLAVNMLAGYTINRVTMFALILALGLLVDDPIVDVENISRHFAMRRKATREIVVEAVAEIRPPLIVATLAVIVSFLPMFFLTGMMGPYMGPMALNVPVTMLASMLVAFTITPWLAYHMLKGPYQRGQADQAKGEVESPENLAAVRDGLLYRMFYPLMAPLLRSRRTAFVFLGIIVLLTLAATGLGAFRLVPLKMLPLDNKNELLFVIDLDEGTTLERSDAAVRAFEQYLAGVPEVTDFTSYVGNSSPMDFNGLVRHYYLRRGPNVAGIRVNLVGKKSREAQSHAIGLRMRDDLTRIAHANSANLKIVEIPPGPPVLSTVAAEVYGRDDNSYADLIAAARTVRARMEREPFVVDVDDTIEADQQRRTFVVDKEKAALNGITQAQITDTLEIALAGRTAGTLRVPDERNPLRIVLRVPRALRSSPDELTQIHLKSRSGDMVPLAELGHWEQETVDKTIYHKNLRSVVYVMAEVVGRSPADAVVDLLADRADAGDRPAEAQAVGSGWIADAKPKPLSERSFVHNGGGVAWSAPDGIDVIYSGEGEWHDTLRVFRDLGLAFAAALVAIYILLVGQFSSFLLPVVVMLAIPLTILGIMPGFWLLNVVAAGQVGAYADPIFFTATAMIGMIALSGIVTRQAVIIVDFVHLSLARGHSLFDAILLSCSVRLRPILLTVLTDMLAAAPIVFDPIFSGLAWALIFGLLASTVFTLFVIPVAYWLLYADTADRAESGRV